MVYLANIPQPTDSPSTQSQAQFLENFTQLDTQFTVDHIALTAAANNGEHTKVTLNTVLGADPNLASPKASLYTKADGAGTSQLFFQNFDLTAAANITRQLSNLPVTTVGTNYGITCPWGLIFNWGLVTTTANTPVVVTFAVAYTSAVHSIQLTPIFNSGADRTVVVSTGSVALNQFSVRSSNNGMNAYYFAIGV